jgi:hypothetical protein
MIEQILMSQSQQNSPVILYERLETAQRVLVGELDPVQRRQQLLRSRMSAEEGSTQSSFENDTTQDDEQSEDPSANTSERASRTGTASKSDIEQAAPKVGANRPDDDKPAGSSQDTSESTSDTTPSMSEAANKKMKLKGVN